MHIITASEVIPVDHPIFLIVGQPGICKTSLGYSAERPLLLDFDKGSHRAANRRDTLVINAWSDIEELMRAKAELEPYATIVVDTVGRCVDLLATDIAEKEPKKAPGGVLTLQGWGTLKTRFRQWMNALRAMGFDVLLLAHDKEDGEADARFVRADISGGSYSEVMKIADFVGYLYMAGKDRVLDFSPTDRWVGKNPAQWPPFKVPPVAKATDMVADLMVKGRAALGALSEASAKVAGGVQGWRSKIDATKDADAATAVLAGLLVAEEGPLVVEPAKKLLWDRAKEQGWAYDGTTKRFVVAVGAKA